MQHHCTVYSTVQYSVQYTGGHCSAAASAPAQQDMLAAGWIRAAEKTVVRRQGQRLLAAIFRNSILGLDNYISIPCRETWAGCFGDNYLDLDI